MTLVLGPLLFNWAPERWRDFYFRIADEAPVDRVHVGEVVCAKRTPLAAPYLSEVLERLDAAGKETVISTLALIGDAREGAALRDLVAGADRMIEANDLGTADLLAGRPHAIGPFVNVYNEATLDFLARRAAVRICLPPELPAGSIAALARAQRADCRVEVLVFGRLPLAISARCFHARVHGLHKDGCRYICGDDPDGLAVETIEGRPFVAVNGTQTLSYTVCNLAGEIAALRAMGVDCFRLSPQDGDMVAVAGLFRGVTTGALSATEADERLAALLPGRAFANGFIHAAEGHRRVRARLAEGE